MKILFLSDYSTQHGGAEITMTLLRDELRARGHKAILFASSAKPIDVPGVADVECFGTVSRYRTLLQTVNPSAFFRLRVLLREFRPDIVHVGMFLTQLSPLILPLIKNYPAVYQAHWLRAICPTGSKLLPDGTPCDRPAGIACHKSGCLALHDWALLMGQMQLWRRWREAFDIVAANSEATRRSLIGAGIKNVIAIPCGVPVGEVRSPLSGAPTALFSGRLSREKGVHVLLRAWNDVLERVPNARLLIAGDGPERQGLEQSAPAGVVFLGHLSFDEMNRIARDAWVQVVPSIGQESFGLVAAEAAMRGSAVIASALGGLAEIVLADRTGKLVAPNDSIALSEALSVLLSDRALCEAMGKAGRRVAEERFSADIYVERFLTLYRTLLDRYGRVGMS